MSDASEVKRYKTSPGWYEINDVTEYNGASVRLKPSYTSSTEFKADLEDKQKEVSKDVFRQRDNMSDASEVKRWTLTQLDRLSSNSWDNPTFVSSQDHDRIVATLKAEVEELKKSADTIATQARKLDLARVLYRAAIKIIDRYSTEKFPLTPTIEDVMDRYDKELAAIENEEAKDNEN